MILDSRSGEPRYLAWRPASPSGAFGRSGFRCAGSFHCGHRRRAAFCRPIPTMLSTRCRTSKRSWPGQYQERRNQLQVALENKAQQVLLRYLEGDEAPQTRAGFRTRRALHGCRANAHAGVSISRGPSGFLSRPRLVVRQEISGSGAAAGTIRAHRPWWRLWFQRARHRLSGAGAIRQGDSCFPRRVSGARSIGLIRCTTRLWPTSKWAITDPRSAPIRTPSGSRRSTATCRTTWAWSISA